jgi:hypothetical protein
VCLYFFPGLGYTHIYIYIYIYACVCICASVCLYFFSGLGLSVLDMVEAMGEASHIKGIKKNIKNVLQASD